ncbi:MAG: AAA family ATPase [Mycobacteriales bacterium]
MGGNNPYHYGTPAEGVHFTGRTKELATLLTRVRDGINVVVISPRRYGKTSLLRAATARMTRWRPPPAVVAVNLQRAASPARFVDLLIAAAYKIPRARWSRARQAVPEFLRRLRIAPSVTFDQAGNPRFAFDAALAPAAVDSVLSDVYQLLADEAERRPAVLVLDEFQVGVRLAAHLPDFLKGLADTHPRVSLVLAGSQRHLIEQLVLAQAAPLYGLAQHIALGPIPADEMISYLVERAADGGKSLPVQVAEYLLELSGPVPNDIQHLAYDTFEVADTNIDITAVNIGMAHAVEHDAALFADALTHLSPGQSRVLAAVAADPPTEPYSAAFARSVGLANASSVRKALTSLFDDDVVVERDSRLVVADPFFAAWLRAEN